MVFENTDIPTDLPEKLQVLIDYWQDQVDRLGRLPMLDEINLMDIYKIAPRIFMADRIVLDDGAVDYVWRYWGGTLCQFAGADLTGKRLSQTHDDAAVNIALESYGWALKTGKPHYFAQALRVKGARHADWDYQRVIVPLSGRSSPGGEPEAKHILGVYVSVHDRDIHQHKAIRDQTASFQIS